MIKMGDCSQATLMQGNVYVPDHVDFHSRPSKCVRFQVEVSVYGVPNHCSSRVGTWVQDAAREARQCSGQARGMPDVDCGASANQAEYTRKASFVAEPIAVTDPILNIWDECPTKPATYVKRRSRLEALYMGTLPHPHGTKATAEQPNLLDFRHPLMPSMGNDDSHESNPKLTVEHCRKFHPSKCNDSDKQHAYQHGFCAICDPKASWADFIVAVSEMSCQVQARCPHLSP